MINNNNNVLLRSADYKLIGVLWGVEGTYQGVGELATINQGVGDLAQQNRDKGD